MNRPGWRAVACWVGAGAVLSLVLLAAAASGSSGRPEPARASPPRATAGVSAAHPAVARADQVCRSYRGAARELASATGGSDRYGGMTRAEAVAFYGQLLPLTEQHVHDLAAIAAPPPVRHVLDAVVADATEGRRLLARVAEVTTRDDDAADEAVDAASNAVLAHLQRHTGHEEAADDVGFTVCGRRDWLVVLAIESIEGPA